MALVMPLFLLIILGIIEFSRVGMVLQMLTTAAREGCRAAVIDGSTAADVRGRIEQELQGTGIPVPSSVVPTPTNWQTAPQGTPITVSLSVSYDQISWLPGSPFFGSAVLSSSATLASERVN